MERHGASYRVTQTLPGEVPNPGTRKTKLLPTAGSRPPRTTFDHSIVNVGGTPTRRTYASRYDEGGNFVSQGYIHYGPATANEVRRGTWSGDARR
jgi:hypothetical protein